MFFIQLVLAAYKVTISRRCCNDDKTVHLVDRAPHKLPRNDREYPKGVDPLSLGHAVFAPPTLASNDLSAAPHF